MRFKCVNNNLMCFFGVALNSYHYIAVFNIINETSRNVVENPVERCLRDGTIIGLANHTVLVFNSDNCGFINQYKKRNVTDNYPLRSGKGSLYEGGVRVPLLDSFRETDAVPVSVGRYAETRRS